MACTFFHCTPLIHRPKQVVCLEPRSLGQPSLIDDFDEGTVVLCMKLEAEFVVMLLQVCHGDDDGV